MDWLPSITTTTLLGAALWLCRNVLLQRLQNSVRHEFDEKLENIRSKIREKESQIEALRSGVLDGVSHRQAILYERKLKATEEIWAAVSSMAGAKQISEIMSQIKFEAAAKESEKNPQAREIFKAVGKSFDPEKIDALSAFRARPFVSKLVWAYYSAYKAIISQSILRLEALKAGWGQDFSKSEEMVALVKAALPHHGQHIERYGRENVHYFLDELETKILSEIENILKGKLDDNESLNTAANILKAADALFNNDQRV